MCLGIPMRVESLDGTLAVVSAKGVRRQVDVSLLGEEVAVGEHVLVHVGYAISKVDEEEVKETWELLDQLFQKEGEVGDA